MSLRPFIWFFLDEIGLQIDFLWNDAQTLPIIYFSNFVIFKVCDMNGQNKITVINILK